MLYHRREIKCSIATVKTLIKSEALDFIEWTSLHRHGACMKRKCHPEPGERNSWNLKKYEASSIAETLGNFSPLKAGLPFVTHQEELRDQAL
jgi:hypothetical protein